MHVAQQVTTVNVWVLDKKIFCCDAFESAYTMIIDDYLEVDGVQLGDC